MRYAKKEDPRRIDIRGKRRKFGEHWLTFGFPPVLASL
jgi:hypothetical protein